MSNKYLGNFPVMFFLLGMVMELFIFATKGWIELVVIILFLTAYFLIKYWFNWEMNK